MKRIAFFMFPVFCCGLALISDADAADTPTLLGQYDGWSAYEFGHGKAHTCYALVDAQKPAKGTSSPHLMVTHRPGENTVNVVEADLGTDLPINGKGVVVVGSAHLEFFTKNHSAWAPDSDTDQATVAAMSKGKHFSIDIGQAKGAALSATFPLAGFPRALAAIDKACKVKR